MLQGLERCAATNLLKTKSCQQPLKVFEDQVGGCLDRNRACNNQFSLIDTPQTNLTSPESLDRSHGFIPWHQSQARCQALVGNWRDRSMPAQQMILTAQLEYYNSAICCMFCTSAINTILQKKMHKRIARCQQDTLLPVPNNIPKGNEEIQRNKKDFTSLSFQFSYQLILQMIML